MRLVSYTYGSLKPVGFVSDSDCSFSLNFWGDCFDTVEKKFPLKRQSSDLKVWLNSLAVRKNPEAVHSENLRFDIACGSPWPRSLISWEAR